MKQLFFLLIPGFLFISCKKDSSGPVKKTVLLTKTLSNGKTNYNFLYAADNKLTRIESYDETPANALSSSLNISYHDNGQIDQLTSYQEPGAIASSRLVIQYNADNRIQTASVYNLQGPTPNTPSSSQTWTYNVNGLFIRLDRKDKNDQLLERTNISYYDNNTLKKIEQFAENGNQLYLTARINFSVPSGNYPMGLEQIMIILGADFTAMLYNESIQRFNYDQNGVISLNTMQQMSGREYNADSTLAKQTITLKKLKPAGDDVVIFSQYEYSAN